MTGKLWVVMPAYNEEGCVRHVAEEWLQTLKQNYPDFIFLALNDGSRDSTFAILNSIAGKEPNFRVIDKLNSGHGQTCLEGYRIALTEAAEWILQIDSDGQCDPVYFERFLNEASGQKIIYGWRKSRDDGCRRLWISRFVTLAAFVATGFWVKDGNVPYRLMHRTTLEKVVGLVPSDFHLANIFVAVLQEKYFGISWVPIHFRNRMGGRASVKTRSFIQHGVKLFRQLRTAIPR
jgi:dolichol-phosphate mannosyltransferase